jgi:outer membrane protein OmpA-like peptidoglycan-associated protein
MKTIGFLILVASVALVNGCATTVPSELTDARHAYLQASEGPAAQLAPAELHKAKEALAQAEASFSDDSDSYNTLDLAYVATRRAQMAEAKASIAMEQSTSAHAEKNYEVIQGDLLAKSTQDLDRTATALALSKNTEQDTAARLSAEKAARMAGEQRAVEQREAASAMTKDLDETRTALAASQKSGQEKTEQLGAEQEARRTAEKKAADAQAELTKLAAITDDARGTVITLSGSVLFRSNESSLMPGAESRLDLVVDALSGTTNRNVVVEGYTDSQGSDEYNYALSRRRSEVVRDYLVHRGYPGALVRARGMGEGRPIADNSTAEGRANNRRVEIILERAAKQ